MNYMEETKKDRARARAKSWYHANKERAALNRIKNYDPAKAKEYNKKYRQKHAAEVKQYDKERSKTEKRKSAAAEWRKRNSQKIVDRVSVWAKENPDKVTRNAKNSAMRRRARLKNAPYETIDLDKVYEINEGLCGLCYLPVDKSEFELDHIIPIAKRGGHVYPNVHIAHRYCNKKKGASLGANIFSI